MNKEAQNTQDEGTEFIPGILPLLPLRDVVIFPHMIFPVLVGRESSIEAVNSSIESDKLMFVCSQKDPHDEDPEFDALHHQGAVVKILQVLKLPNGLLKVLVDGLVQAKVVKYLGDKNSARRVRVRVVKPAYRLTTRLNASVRQLDALFKEYVKMHRNIPNETLIAYESLGDPVRKLYYAASNMLVSVDAKQALLVLEDLEEQLYELVRLLRAEIEIMKMEYEIDGKVQSTIQRSQRKYIIQEQIRLLQNELEDDGDLSPTSEFDALRKQIENVGLPEHVRQKAHDELQKLERTPAMSPEATVSRNYLDWLLAMPWNTATVDTLSVKNAKKVLDEDHYGLKKPKDRILEQIAVLNLVRDMKGQILCFVGPPGVGKTSLGKSIARSLNRRFVRISLGGVHDEAEIRGHRRTYIGSMPGKIIQALKKAGSANPVMLMDEIDKMSSNYQGDPASALLEVLDPEQNCAFNDHYLDVDFDLSKVLFITTANVRYNIPLPLQDRMEIIELPGYLEHEKLEIAKRFLIRKQAELHGLTHDTARFDDAAIMRIIREYTREAGVRNLERSIATICRKIAGRIVEAEGFRPEDPKSRRKPMRVKAADVEEHLGVPHHRRKKRATTKVGSVTGLAWTSAGGDILRVDVTFMPGSDKFTLTGQLGEVMKESAQAALSYLRAHADQLDVEPAALEKKDIHIHIPEGAIPKDGPSAGLTMALALISAACRRPARSDVAMTGEITLHGDVLAIGGLNEKLLAAKRHGLKTVLVPLENEPDLREVPDAIKKGLDIVPISRIEEAIPLVFARSKSRGNRKA